MNAPPVQYVKTDDGYNIAFTVRGNGPPLMVLPFGFSHAQAIWIGSSATPLMQTLAEHFRVAYFDGRGQGLSQRGIPPETSIESLLKDIRAVIQKAGTPKQVLLADNAMAHLAAHYAFENPDRVRALVLMHCPVSLVAQVSWISTLVAQNWEYYLNSQAGAVPMVATDVSRLAARVEGLKTRTTQEDFYRRCTPFAASDLSEILPRIVIPTLVLHIPSQGWVTQEESAATAALLPNGRLAVVSGSTFFGDASEVVAAIEAFLAESESEQARPPADAASILSSREIEVLKLVAAGKTNQQIADELVISLNTVNRHVSNVYAKTGAANRADAVSYAHRHALAG